jgi:hypothetical protein
MEGIRMVDEWPIIEKKIPSMDLVFRAVVDPAMVEVAAGDEDHGGKKGAAPSTKIRLTAEEERVFRRVDGTRTVQAIIDSTGASDFDVCRILFDFLNRNIIAPVGRGGASRESSISEPVEPASPVTGYLLVAAAVVLSIFGGVVQWKTPFGLIGRPPLIDGSLVLGGVTRARLERLDRSIVAYHLAHGAAPGTLDELVEEGLADAAQLRDPWSRPYHYAITDGGYLLNAVDDGGKMVPGSLIERTLPRGPS